MKKLGIIFVMLLIITGCFSESKSAISKDRGGSTKDSLIEDGTNYEIYDISKYNSNMYQYFIFNGEKEVLESNVAMTWEPKISNNSGLVKIMRFAGTGVFYCYFVDTKAGEISQVYHTPFADSETYVAVFDKVNLQIAVYDIFSGEVIEEIKRDFDNQMTDFTMKGKFSEDNKILTVTYLNMDRDEVTEDIEINRY